ncbi:MAG TPA: DUF4019 domain-containing protein [Casimicrobiaceae bacterium]|jgi:hypothetical protein|nr:DUF4019 domain-containing protein [Casimicrobiaceae bacterium]
MMRRLRWFWFAVVCLALFVAAGVQAQDPRASEAQAAARSWLLIADKGDVEASWSAAGKKFREVLDLTTWRQALTEARGPLGDVQTRTMRATRFDAKMPGGPDGDYAQVLFETDFAKNSGARETVTLEREPDGVWRVMGYLIR